MFCISLIEIAICCTCYCTWEFSDHIWGSKELSPKEESMQKELNLPAESFVSHARTSELLANSFFNFDFKFIVENQWKFLCFKQHFLCFKQEFWRFQSDFSCPAEFHAINKGQTRLKCFYQVDDSSKKRMNYSVFCLTVLKTRSLL